MSGYDCYSDDYYVNMNLNTEMELQSGRETVLHFFEQVQKHYPTMRNFYCRDRGEYVLEEDKDQGHYRWTTVENRRVCSGQVNPNSIDEALQQHLMVLDMVPYSLSISSLDCESLSVMLGFDYTYRGNHNQLITEALGVHPMFERLTDIPGAIPIAYEPSIQVALDEDCRVQCRVSVETRTLANQIRIGEYVDDQLSVYLTVRRFGSLEPDESFSSTMQRLTAVCREILDNYVVDSILLPLQQTISLK